MEGGRQGADSSETSRDTAATTEAFSPSGLRKHFRTHPHFLSAALDEAFPSAQLSIIHAKQRWPPLFQHVYTLLHVIDVVVERFELVLQFVECLLHLHSQPVRCRVQRRRRRWRESVGCPCFPRLPRRAALPLLRLERLVAAQQLVGRVERRAKVRSKCVVGVCGHGAPRGEWWVWE